VIGVFFVMLVLYESVRTRQFRTELGLFLSCVPPLTQVQRLSAAGRGLPLAQLCTTMHKGNYVAASFPLMRYATGAIDWFRNQAVDPSAILVAAVGPDGRPRAPQRGDNARTDLRWIVAIDCDAARIAPSVAAATLQREGGKRLAHVPELPGP
jgi:hypothetical protein